MEKSHPFTLGDFQCWAILDELFVGNAEMLFSNAPEGDLREILQRYDLQPDHLPTTWTCLLVKTPTHTVLVDTGIGTSGPKRGQLLSRLREVGFLPQDIDVVILTHAHSDHIGGAVDGSGNVTFPKANHYIWQEEWDFWTTEATLSKAPEWAADVARKILPPLAPSIKTIRQEGEIVPGIRAVAAPGHTVGHMVVEVVSRGECLLNIADAALHPIQVEYPQWYATLDQFPEQTVRTRVQLFQRAAEQNALVLAFHFPPYPSLGYIVRQNGGWQWQALPA